MRNHLEILNQVFDFKDDEISNSIRIYEENENGGKRDIVQLKVERERIKNFTNLLRQSFLTSLFSFMELWLTRECYIESKGRDHGKSYKLIKKHGIEKAMTYFSKVMGNNYSFETSSDWQWLRKFQRLRDCIVHRQGSLTGLSDFERDRALEKFVEQESDLCLFGVENNQIFIEQAFCIKALKIVHKFIIELLELDPKTGN